MDKKIIIVSMMIAVIAISTIAYIIVRPPSQVVLYVYPQTINARIGQNFTVTIRISGVTDLYGWQSTLKWNSTILDAMSIVKGAFLKSSTSEAFFSCNVSSAEGSMLLVGSLTGETQGTSGDGVLATMQFHVKEEGNCNLDLYGTELSDSSEKLMEHATNGGHVNASS
jgi:hypothetical protein